MKSETSSQLECVTIETNPGKPVDKCIIWLHGLGADGHDFAPITPRLAVSSEINIKFIFPHAPLIPVTINNGYIMRAWFDIHGLSLKDRVDETGIAQSIKNIEALITDEITQGLTSDHIILAGFSQGGVLALITALQHKQPLGGVIVLSSFLPREDEVLAKVSEANKHLPVFMAHGTQDTVVQFSLGEAAYKTLQQAGFPIEWHSYPMAHSVCEEEIEDIVKWLGERL